AFTEADRASSARVAIVNRSFAKLVWGNQSAVGQCMHVGADSLPCATIVGIVEDIHRNTILEGPQVQYYLPRAQWLWPVVPPAMIVRSRTTDVAGTANAVRRSVQSIPGDAPYPIVDSFANFV